MLLTRISAIILVFTLAAGACSRPGKDENSGQAAVDPAPVDGDSAGAAPPAPETIPRTPAPDGARVFFITPADGDTVSNPVRIEFGLASMRVAKAGDALPDSGHHHLLIDTDLPDLGLPIPATSNHVHFGDGSTSTEISLDPGEHTLRLLLGDYRHIPHDPAVASDPITVIVE